MFYDYQEDARCTCHATRQYCALLTSSRRRFQGDDFKKTISKRTLEKRTRKTKTAVDVDEDNKTSATVHDSTSRQAPPARARDYCQVSKDP